MLYDIVNTAKAQIQFAVQWIDNEATITEKEKNEFKR